MSQNNEERGFGSILKEARLSKNMSLEDVSKGTKIHLNILKSIESEDVLALGAVYAKSFIRIYADFLGLDKEDLVRRFEGFKSGLETGRPKDVRQKSIPQASSSDLVIQKNFFDVFKKIPWGRVIVIFIVALVLWNFGKFLHKRKAESALKKKIEIKVFEKKEIQPPREITQDSLKKKSGPVEKTKKDALKASVSKTLKTTQAKKVLETTTVKKASFVKKTEKLLLVIRTKEKTWLQVKVDGKIVFQGVLGKGVADSWQAEEKIELWLGNAGVVQLELNGRLLEKIGRPGQTLKRVLVTQSGLSIEK